MQAKQASQFFKSKYEMSRMHSQWGYSQFSNISNINAANRSQLMKK